MPKRYYAVLLLVCLSVAITHAGIMRPANGLAGHNPVVTSPLQQGVAATLPLTAAAPPKASLFSEAPLSPASEAATSRRQQRERRDDGDSVNVRTPLSVVQDWSLVCQQLCGAVEGVALASANGNRENSMRLMCQELCRLQIGDDVCQCARNALATASPSKSNEACHLICTRHAMAMATLIDCKACSPDTAKAPQGIAEPRKMAFDAHAVRDVVDGMGDDVNGAVEVVDETEPNWDELCAQLCKTGDGGSLCNCDLSPFFRVPNSAAR